MLPEYLNTAKTSGHHANVVTRCTVRKQLDIVCWPAAETLVQTDRPERCKYAALKICCTFRNVRELVRERPPGVSSPNNHAQGASFGAEEHQGESESKQMD
jgi:hypothetical protein